MVWLLPRTQDDACQQLELKPEAVLLVSEFMGKHSSAPAFAASVRSVFKMMYAPLLGGGWPTHT